MTTQQTAQIIATFVQGVLWPLALILLPWLFHRFIKSLPIVQQTIINNIVKHAVQMVKQKFAGETDEEKRKQAEMAIYAMASFFGIKDIDPDIVNTILESIVWETKQATIETLEPAIVAPESPKPA